VGALHRPAAAGLDRGWHAPRGDLADHATRGQRLPAGLVVVGGVQVHHRPGGQHPDHAWGIQRGRQQPVVATVGWRRHRTQRDAIRVGEDRTLQALLAAVDRAGPGDLPAAGRLGDAAVHRQVVQFQAEQPVVGAKHRALKPVGKAQGDPLIPAAAQRGG
jgi:hypothetical protein